MSSIGQGPTQTDQVNTSGNIPNKSVDYSDNSVRRGYSDQNSYSRVENEEAAIFQQPKPRLDSPTKESYSDSAQQEVLKDFQQSQEKPASDFFRQEGKDFFKKGLEEGIKNVEKQVAELTGEKKAKSEAVANPAGKEKAESPAGTLSTASSDKKPINTANASATEAAKLNIPTVEQWDKLEAAFKDVYVKAGSIKEAPPGFKEEIQAEFTKFAQQVFGGKKPLDVDSATTMLMTIQTKLQDNRLKFDQETIKIKQVEYDQQFKESISKIREQIAETKKAKDASLVSKIFGWVAVAVMAVVTAVVATVGILTGGVLTAVAVGMMVASLAIVLSMQVSNEVGSSWMMDIFGDGKDAKIGAMAFWTSLIIALSIGAAAVGGGAGAGAGASSAANATTTGASAGATATATGTNTAATAATLTAKVTNISNHFTRGLKVVGGSAMMGDGAAQIVSTKHTYNAEMLRADAMENRAFMLRLQQQIDDAAEAIAQVIEELQSGYKVAADILRADHETKTNLLSKLKA